MGGSFATRRFPYISKGTTIANFHSRGDFEFFRLLMILLTLSGVTGLSQTGNSCS